MAKVIEYLRSELSERSRRNPHYSIRAFARSAGIHSSTLSALLNGRRVLTVKTARGLLERLGVEPQTSRRLLEDLLLPEDRVRASGFRTLNKDDFELIASWEHYAILSLLELKHTKGTVLWIAQRLAIPTGIALDSLQRLERLGWVTQVSKKWVLARRESRTTVNDVPQAALRRANRQYIERALRSLEAHGVAERDVTGITMAISKKRLPEAKAMIREFRRELCRFLESDEKDAVYRLNVQLFPLEK
jgi:uncharacterized protein (TIGR02147 family)